MLAPWTGRYIGIPYKTGGRDRHGADCYGLVRLILAHEYSIMIQEFSGYEGTTEEERAGLIDMNLPLIDAAEIGDGDEEAGDIILLRLRGQPCHVGIIAGSGYMIHTLKGHDSARERYQDRKWARRIEGFYRVR